MHDERGALLLEEAERAHGDGLVDLVVRGRQRTVHDFEDGCVRLVGELGRVSRTNVDDQGAPPKRSPEALWARDSVSDGASDSRAR